MERSIIHVISKDGINIIIRPLFDILQYIWLSNIIMYNYKSLLSEFN